MSSSKRQTAKKPQKRFQFIDNSNISATGTNSTQVRRHVMQEYMREKRWESRARAEKQILDLSTQPQSEQPSVTARPGPSLRKSPPAAQSQTPPLNAQDVRSSTQAGISQTHTAVFRPNIYPAQTCDHRTQSLTRLQTQATQDSVDEIQRSFIPATQLEIKPRKGFYLTPQAFASLADINEVSPPTPPSTIISGRSVSPTSPSSSKPFATFWKESSNFMPVSILSAARTDPFDTLPMALSKQDQELFDFYATVMPSCSYGFERRSPKAHNWYLSVFIPEAMKSSVAFQNTVLVHAANTQAWVRGLSETPLAIEHQARASQMLLEHFRKHPLDTSDAAISSTLSAAALEDFDPRIERRKYAWMHWNVAVQKIRDRGGPAALEQNKSLRMLINWSDYIFSGYNSFGSSFAFRHVALHQQQTSIDTDTHARNEVMQQCEELIVFLKCAESLALVAANLQNNPAARKNQPMRFSVFEPGQPLYNLLASPNGPRYTKTGQLKQIISRLAALMTINVAIWEYRYSTAASEEFFQELVDNIRFNNLDQHISVEALLQILLSGSENPYLIQTERPWLVGRLLKLAKRLSRRSWEQLNDFLLSCLTLDSSIRPIMETWEYELRAEIQFAPLVSHVLPLMQAP